MRATDLGININTGYHDRRLTPAESAFIGALWPEHVGQKNALSADELAVAFCKRWTGVWIPLFGTSPVRNLWKREVRHMQNHLLKDHAGVPVLSASGDHGGYWIAASEDEAAGFYETFRRRGLTGLVKASRGKQSAMVDMVAQLSFEFEELVGKGDPTPMIRPRSAMPTPIEVVDAFLERMTKDPDQFADGLRKIGNKYSAILMPRERLAMIQSRVAEIQDLVEGIGK